MDASYRTTQTFGALWTLMPLTTLGVAAVLWLSGDPKAQLGIAIVLATTVVSLALFGRLVIEIRGDALQWRFGWLGLPRGTLPLARITGCELARGSKVGAGIRGTRRCREITAALDTPAVRFTLDDGRTVLIGSPEPERLRQFVDARLPKATSHRR